MGSQSTKNVNLKLDVQGREGVVNLRAEFDAVKESLKQLTQSYRNGETSEEQYRTSAAALKTNMRDLAGQLKDLGDKAVKAKRGLAGMGQSMLQTGRIVQDFAQGGIGGVLNNIEGFTQAVGGSSGMAGALTVVGVLFFLLKPHLAEFAEWITSTAPEIKDMTGLLGALEEKIKELSAKPHKIAIEFDQLETAQKAADHLRDVLAEIKTLNKPDQDKEDTKKAYEDAVVEIGGGADKVAGGLVKTEKQQLGGLDHYATAKEKHDLDEIKEDREYMARGYDNPLLDDEDRRRRDSRVQQGREIENEIRSRLARRALDKARREVGEAATSPQALTRIRAQVARAPGNFAGDLGSALQDATPEGIEAAKQVDRDIADSVEGVKDRHDKKDARKKREDDAIADADAEFESEDAKLQESNQAWKAAKARRRREGTKAEQADRKRKADLAKAAREKEQKARAHAKHVADTAKRFEAELGPRIRRDQAAAIADGFSLDQANTAGLSGARHYMERHGVGKGDSHEAASKLLQDQGAKVSTKAETQRNALEAQGFNPIMATQQAALSVLKGAQDELEHLSAKQSQMRKELSDIQRRQQIQRRKS